MKNLISILVLLLTQMLFGQTAEAPAGNGTIESPYQIETLNNLYWIAASTTRWAAYYEQTADIIASSTSDWPGGGWTPIGSDATKFTGSYNGQGYVISGLYIHRSAANIGLFGVTNGATIENLGVTSVDIIAYDHTGGLIGKAFNSTVRYCYTSGNVYGQGNGNDYAYTGGLIGTIESSSNVSNCYSIANVSGPIRQWGGFTSYISSSSVTNCYSAGVVAGGTSATGGFVGSVSSATVSNCFWDTEASTRPSSAAGEGKTTAQMKDYTTFTGWDFILETANGSNSYWDMDQLVTVNSGYPILSWQTGSDDILEYSGGLGTSANPYQISTLIDLSTLVQRSIDWNKYFIQTADIDASTTSTWNGGAGWSPIGYDWDHAFYGSYDGGNHSISGLTIKRSGSLQAFTAVARDASFQNLTLANASIETLGQDEKTGTLVGQTANVSITNCHASGTVKGMDNVGGIIGYHSGTMTNCSFTGTVLGNSLSGTYQSDNMGGLIGYNNGGSVEDSYASATITGNWVAGGLVGYNNAGTINRCYSTTPEGGYIFGSYFVGGLVGQSTNSGSISKSYSTATVVGYVNIAGGLVGDNNGSTISNCYSRESVSRSQGSEGDFGSFIGKNENTTVVTDCYSTGTVIFQNATNPTDKGFIGNYNATGCSDNFFDSETTYQISGAGATTKITTEMKTASTFSAWDSNIWNLDTFNDGYPYLDWQNPSGTPLPVELTSFNASVSGGKVTLNWQTATEVNNYGFEIQRSVVSGQRSVISDQRSEWETIGFVEGHGNSNSPKDYSFIDENPGSGKFEYRLKQIDNNGNFGYSAAIEVEINQLPTELKLYQNYPNPFNPSTVISWQLPVSGHVSIKVYDILGNEVAALVDDNLSAGNYEIEFDASQLSSGVYFYSLSAGDFHQTKKMIVLK